MMGPPKPRMVLRIKIGRLPERRSVTIIAGFKCQDGVVVCGDTQETLSFYKRNVQKVKVEPPSERIHKLLGGSDLAAVFCGAGHGPFIDLLTRRAWLATKKADSLDTGCLLVEEMIKDTYREYGGIYQSGACPERGTDLRAENARRESFVFSRRSNNKSRGGVLLWWNRQLHGRFPGSSDVWQFFHVGTSMRYISGVHSISSERARGGLRWREPHFCT